MTLIINNGLQDAQVGFCPLDDHYNWNKQKRFVKQPRINESQQYDCMLSHTFNYNRNPEENVIRNHTKLKREYTWTNTKSKKLLLDFLMHVCVCLFVWPGVDSYPAGDESATGCSCMVSSPNLLKAAPAAEKISPTYSQHINGCYIKVTTLCCHWCHTDAQSYLCWRRGHSSKVYCHTNS